MFINACYLSLNVYLTAYQHTCFTQYSYFRPISRGSLTLNIFNEQIMFLPNLFGGGGDYVPKYQMVAAVSV